MLAFLLVLWTSLQTPLSFPDSLLHQISRSESDSAKAAMYLDLAKHYYGFEQDTAIRYAQQSLELAERAGQEKIQSNAYNVMGVALLIRSEYEEALKTHLRALAIREKLQDSTGVMESNINIGNVYYRNGDMGRAAEMYEKALGYALAVKHLRGQSMIYNNLGNYYKDRWNRTEDPKDYEQALTYVQQSLRIKEELNDHNGLVKTLTQLSQLTIQDKAKAKEYLLRALSIAEANQNTENKISVLHELANYHLQQKDYAQVKDYARQAYTLAKEAGSHFYISISAEYLVDAALGQNDYKAAYEYLSIKKDADEAVFNDSRQKIREELLVQYETEKKELENQRLTHEQQFLDLSIRRRNELLAGTAVLVLVFGVLYWQQKKNHGKLKRAHQQLEDAHLLATSQNAQIQEQADRLNATNHELSRANKFRDKIFSVISHDLRAPFSSLHSIIQLWDKKILSEEELFEVMPLIARETNALSLMLNNLLMWAKSHLGAEEVQAIQFDLDELVSENIDLLLPQILQKNQTLSLDRQAGLRISSDRERLSFILRNILMNAIKFTPSEGKITVAYPSPDEILIRDTGAGMSPTMLAKLFTDRVASQKGTEGESGTGIGLMLCQEFAESIGAKILVESSPGKGSTFRIVLN